MAGYGVYDGIGGIPYSVGSGGGAGAPSQPTQMAPSGPSGPATPAQAAPGAYGANIYAQMMPQWMQNYFDTNLTGLGSLSSQYQRAYATEGMDYLKSRYGEKAAMNPYFAQMGGVDKGFNPFGNSVYTTESMEENPELQKYIQTQRYPFSGAALGTST